MFYHPACVVLAMLVVAFAALPVSAAPANGSALLASRLRDRLCADPPAPETVRKLLDELTPEGTWPDVNYDSHERGGWRTIVHLQRTLQLAVACTAPASPNRGDPAVLAATERALAWWLTANRERPQWSPNWWFNEIAIPLALGDIGILLQGRLKPDTERALCERLALATPAMTGQNWVWRCGAVLKAAILADDEPGIAKMFANIFREVQVTRAEGLQPDASFHQHGAQQQFGNYGLSYAHDMVGYVDLAAGTPWALPDARLALLRQYLLDGQAWLVWRGQYDLNACGRQILSAQGKGISARRVLARMQTADAGHAKAYADAFAGTAAETATPAPLGGHAYYCSDLLIHRTPGWMLSVQLTSNRTIPNESLNSENALGLYVGLGSAFLYCSGKEYADLPRVWDWRRIPGSVAPLADGPILPGQLRNASPFAGVVTDGSASLAAMHFKPTGKGSPAWASQRAYAAFPRGYVLLCCVDDNHAAGDAHPVTTIANRLLAGAVISLDARGETVLTPGEHSMPGSGALWHDHVGYVYTGAANALVVLGPRTGSWFAAYPKQEVPEMQKPATYDCFSLALDHGAHVTNPAVACTVLPGIELADLRAYLAQPTLAIVANTPELQAVRDLADYRCAAALYQPGPLPGTDLAVDEPCIVLATTTALIAADPTQALKALHFLAGQRKLALPLAIGDLAGQAATLPLK